VAPQHDEIFKQKANDCVQRIILQKFTNFYAIRSWNFQTICNEVVAPFFLRHPVVVVRVGPVCVMVAEQRQAATDPQTRSTNLGCESLFRLLSTTATITI